MMTKKRTRNAIGAEAARLLRRVVRHIKAEPLRYDQDETLIKVAPGEDFYYTNFGYRPAPACGTVGCLAGWVAALTLPKEKARTVNPIKYASLKLGLDEGQERRLFGSICDWPNKFHQAYYRAKTPAKVAKVAGDRVEYFIKHGK
jgi:hypothetical protein